ncbi:phosphate signaling complex protein PhoU [Thermostichus vulcanus]|uniref:Phosphate-specific transport system accessory protein PhoU n=1 Tax=Thermostichus vulcanus str. 'Rupite' TaxID=2813851 RepID=A0ABT0C8T6_THEVL|nr:phosphate signaling complex protein PhoU [Thermostichus vulcanus]MCJ2542208.1 phosphate signaling complex protein PhoU [Thermostichus vulcanus str. 'Rupite']
MGQVELQLHIKRVQQDVLRMGALAEKSVVLAQQALFEQNLAAAEQVMTQDKQIDYFYRQIEKDCINLIALRSPVARDLRWISTLMQLIRDLERIGDYSKDLAEVALRLVMYPPPPELGRIQVMMQRCQKMLSHSLVALTELDADLGLQLKREDDAVDEDYTSLYNTLAQQSDIKGSIEPILLMLLSIRYLERLADHSTNIGQRVAFIVTGHRD